jgi:hypothetical protein
MFLILRQVANHRVVHEHGLRETNSFAREALEPRAQRPHSRRRPAVCDAA